MIILDTCALVWLTNDPATLSRPAAAAIRRQADALAVLPITAWEVAVKCRSGGLTLTGHFTAAEWYAATVARYGLHEIPLDAGLLCASVLLPSIHRDPCDRMLVAAALRQRLAIVTADTTIASYPGVQVIW